MRIDELRFSRSRAALGRYPTVVVVPVAWLWVLGDPVGRIAYLASLALLGLAVLLELVRVRRAWDRPSAGLLPGLCFLAAVGVLRQAGGGLAAGVGVLALVPVFQSALFGRHRRELFGVLLAEAALYLVPIGLVGAPFYPAIQYRGGILTVAVSAAVGLATQSLVDRARREASDARDSREMLERVNQLVHELFAAGDVRADLSAGTVRIAGASVATLYEPEADGETLRCTASAGASLVSVRAPLTAASTLAAAFLSGRPHLAAPINARMMAAPDVWRAAGCPEAVLYQPLVRDGRSIALLAVGWPEAGEADSSRLSAIELLAHEAALVLDRFDRTQALAGMVQTDPLTGLGNRRAWDERVATALRDGRQITVGLLDIDHFKRFNDTYGHPAGDRLLSELAVAWGELLRSEDLLVRLGGEEFGLLLLDCDPEAASAVVARMRDAMRLGQTCSAGLAARRPDEPFESVVIRADRALYDAKASGRDLARTAV